MVIFLKVSISSFGFTLFLLRFVEVYYQGQWGTVCEGYWGMPDAKVACSQLGFTKTVAFSYNGRGTGKVWLYGMGCSGSESSHNG